MSDSWMFHRIYVKDGQLTLCSGLCAGYRGGTWFKGADLDMRFVNCPACRQEITRLPPLHEGLQ